MGLKEFMFGIVIISGVLVGMVTLINGLNYEYPTVLDSDTQTFFSNINQTQKETIIFASGWNSNTTNPNFIAGLLYLGSGVINSILNVGGIFNIAQGMGGFAEAQALRIFPGTEWIWLMIPTLLLLFLTYLIITYMTRTQT